MDPMDTNEAIACWEALKKMPRLPAYAERAIDRLESEFWRARNSEALKEQSLEKVREAMAEAEAEGEAKAPALDKFWR